MLGIFKSTVKFLAMLTSNLIINNLFFHNYYSIYFNYYVRLLQIRVHVLNVLSLTCLALYLLLYIPDFSHMKAQSIKELHNALNSQGNMIVGKEHIPPLSNAST